VDVLNGKKSAIPGEMVLPVRVVERKTVKSLID
jgi:hypothetical protein